MKDLTKAAPDIGRIDGHFFKPVGGDHWSERHVRVDGPHGPGCQCRPWISDVLGGMINKRGELLRPRESTIVAVDMIRGKSADMIIVDDPFKPKRKRRKKRRK